MRTVAPKVETVEQPIEFLDGQDNRFVAGLRRHFEALGFQALEPEAEAVALPVQHFDPITRLVEEDEEHGVEHGDFDIQFYQGSKAVDGLSKVHRLGVEVDFFDFAVGAHHAGLAPEGNREHSIGHQVSALNVGFMEHLRYNSVILESIGREMSTQGLNRFIGGKIHAVIMMALLKREMIRLGICTVMALVLNAILYTGVEIDGTIKPWAETPIKLFA